MIQDKYTGLVNPKTGKPFSRQYIYQLRAAEHGRCIICGCKADGTRCPAHKKEASQRSLAYYYRTKKKKAAIARKRRLARQKDLWAASVRMDGSS